jgi:hypothetical protein
VEGLDKIQSGSVDRFQLCAEIINAKKIKSFAEIGVWKGEFSAYILHNCPLIERYYMIDSWKSLTSWNKPSNVSDKEFETIFDQAMENTNFAKDKRRVLKGLSAKVASHFALHEFDAIYVDADHTLRGIILDLISYYDKVKNPGFILGKAFHSKIWHHGKRYEPTLVFPFAIHFAEAKCDKIYALPFDQFMIEKSSQFSFTDFTGKYDNYMLRDQLYGVG